MLHIISRHCIQTHEPWQWHSFGEWKKKSFGISYVCSSHVVYVPRNDKTVYDKYTRNEIKSSTLLIDVAMSSFYARRQKQILWMLERKNIVLNLVTNTHARTVISKKLYKSFVYAVSRTADEFISVAHLLRFSLPFSVASTVFKILFWKWNGNGVHWTTNATCLINEDPQKWHTTHKFGEKQPNRATDK